MKRILNLFVLFTFVLSNLYTQPVFAQIASLPQPGTLVGVSQPGSLPMLKGLKLNPDNPLIMDFIVEPNGAAAVSKEDAAMLVKYFVAALAMPKEDTWVNLSPYEKERVVPQAMQETDLGKDLLEQDYILKQLSASLTHPNTPQGEKYWNEMNGQDTSTPVRSGSPSLSVRSTTDSRGALGVGVRPSLTKVWIIPNKSSVYEKGNTVLISEATLAVKMEKDNTAFKSNILPLIEKDVNTGSNFANLRQIYSALILAEWFKSKFFESFYKNYINNAKTNGVTIDEKDAKEKIYNLYIEAFKKGSYDITKSERVMNKITKRNYFSGGFTNETMQVTKGPATEASSSAVDVKNDFGSHISGNTDPKHSLMLDKIVDVAHSQGRYHYLHDYRWGQRRISSFYDDYVSPLIDTLRVVPIRVSDDRGDVAYPANILTNTHMAFVAVDDISVAGGEARYLPGNNTIEFFATLEDWQSRPAGRIKSELAHEMVEKAVIDKYGLPETEADAWRAHRLAENFVQSIEELAYAEFYGTEPGKLCDANLEKMSIGQIIKFAGQGERQRKIISERIRHIVRNYAHTESYYPISAETKATWRAILNKFTDIGQLEMVGFDWVHIQYSDKSEDRVGENWVTPGELMSIFISLSLMGEGPQGLLPRLLHTRYNDLTENIDMFTDWLLSRQSDKAEAFSAALTLTSSWVKPIARRITESRSHEGVYNTYHNYEAGKIFSDAIVRDKEPVKRKVLALLNGLEGRDSHYQFCRVAQAMMLIKAVGIGHDAQVEVALKKGYQFYVGAYNDLGDDHIDIFSENLNAADIRGGIVANEYSVFLKLRIGHRESSVSQRVKPDNAGKPLAQKYDLTLLYTPNIQAAHQELGAQIDQADTNLQQRISAIVEKLKGVKIEFLGGEVFNFGEEIAKLNIAITATRMVDSDYISRNNLYLTDTTAQRVEEMDDFNLAMELMDAVFVRYYTLPLVRHEGEVVQLAYERDRVDKLRPNMVHALEPVIPLPGWKPIGSAGAAKKPGQGSNKVDINLRRRLYAGRGVMSDVTEGNVTFKIFKDEEMPDHDAILLMSSNPEHCIIAISVSAFKDGKDARTALARHEIEEMLKLKALTMVNSQKADERDPSIDDRAHMVGQAQEIFYWAKLHPGKLLPRHERALSDKVRAQELIAEWNSGWLDTHKAAWEADFFTPGEITILEQYAKLFNTQAVGGEDFRNLGVKAQGKMDNMELKGSDFSAPGALTVNIISITPFKS